LFKKQRGFKVKLYKESFMVKRAGMTPKVQETHSFQTSKKVSKPALAVTGMVLKTFKSIKTKGPSMRDRGSVGLPQNKEGKEAAKDTQKYAARAFHWKKA
jgi:hypothetical protein